MKNIKLKILLTFIIMGMSISMNANDSSVKSELNLDLKITSYMLKRDVVTSDELNIIESYDKTEIAIKKKNIKNLNYLENIEKDKWYKEKCNIYNIYEPKTIDRPKIEYVIKVFKDYKSCNNKDCLYILKEVRENNYLKYQKDMIVYSKKMKLINKFNKKNKRNIERLRKRCEINLKRQVKVIFIKK